MSHLSNNKNRVMMSSHLHMMLSVKLSLTVNWESSKDLILLNSASFFKNLTHFNTSIMLCKAELTCWHHTAISCALLCLLTSYCQISMFHSWTSCEEIQEDQLCWSNAQIYRDQMSKKKKRHRLSIKLIIIQSWKHIKMKYDEILNFTF